MKPAINQWAFPDDMPTIEAIDAVKRIGFTAFEVCVGENGPTRFDATEADLTAIRKHAENEGIALYSVGSGMGWQYSLGTPDEAVREKSKEITRRLLTMTSWLGAKTLLTVPATVNEEVAYDVAVENALESVRELADHAEKVGVSIGIENVWNKFLLSPTEMRDFIDQCESDYVGAYVDVGNMVLFGYPEQWLRILGKRVHAVHMKDFKRSIATINGFVMLMEGDVDWPKVMAALREIGYDRALTAEYWPYAHSREAMLQHVFTSLQTIMAM